jgi:holo-[acyl-carrier protein] synthase
MFRKVGIDLVEVEDVRAALRAHGERYLQRIYTEGEQRACRRDPRRLAARFAAKEATMKALGCGRVPLAWHTIAVAEDGRGRALIRLSGAAAALAEHARVRHLDLSFTVRDSVGAAVVVADMEEIT